jgi:cob(I)alamin adenosyltransferase
LGLLRDHISNNILQSKIIKIQDDLMTCAAILATDCENCEVKIPKLSETNIVWLETEIDKMENNLPKLSNFILPGGHPAVSFCHVARTVCRRSERSVLSIEDIEKIPEEIIRFLNRLSDYLFVLSRLLTIENQVVEITWQPLLD